MAEDFEKEYNRIQKEKQEAKEAEQYAHGNVINITSMIITPYYVSKKEQQLQQGYKPTDPEWINAIAYVKQNIPEQAAHYEDCRISLETVRPYKNPDSPDWKVVEHDKAYVREYYPKIPENLDSQIDKEIDAILKQKELDEELEKLLEGGDQPDPDTTQQMENAEAQIKQKLEENKKEVSGDGHVYPVGMVQGWTEELKGYNTQVAGYIKLFKDINLDKVDRTWLKKQVQKFVTWLMGKLQKLKQKIIKGLKAMMQHVKKALDLIKPLIEPPSLDTIVKWASNVISVFTEPYQKIITFISDFMTYTPPLIAEAGILSGTVASVPSTINEKVEQLEGEGVEVIKEEIANAVTGVSFSPPSMGDVM